mmetsp:Transcript_62363/g.135381  ORF Transcript_62363/g.135381 Transcript_62363/m.135381 type:complete len:1087 (-) Transcript_62363:4-3264(-)
MKPLRMLPARAWCLDRCKHKSFSSSRPLRRERALPWRPAHSASLTTEQSVSNRWQDAQPYVLPEFQGLQSLNTRQGHVSLIGTNIKAVADHSHEAAQPMSTVLLRSKESRSVAEQENTRREIMDYFHATFSLTEKLHEMFDSPAAFYEKHERLRHPPIFYLGHTAAFYVNKLHLGGHISQRVDPILEMQMAVGVDEMSWDDLDPNSYVWPSGKEAREDPARALAFLQKVLNFRRDVRVLVNDLMAKQPMEWPIGKESFWWVIMMGIEHENIHLETSSVIHRQATLEHLRKVPAFGSCPQGIFHTSPQTAAALGCPVNSLVPVSAGTTRLGRSWEETSTYGWDNEFGIEKQVEVPAFAASKFLVSNLEFLSFVEANGYSTQRYWTEEGWGWVSDMKPRAPRFWQQREGKFYLRTLCEEVPMAWNWPVEVCNHEAAAFCKFLSEKTGKSLRLPSETEYLRLRDSVPTDVQDSAHGPAWGADVPGNVSLAYWASPCPVDLFPSPIGVYDAFGNVWQHSETHIDVFDGFRTHPLYDDFTTPTIGGLHSRIMGASFLSCGTVASRDNRFGFRRHFYQHAGFRYVESDLPVINSVSPYERDREICDALRFHFDAPAEGSFHARLAEVCTDVLEKQGLSLESTKAVELACGPGRQVLELARRGVASVHGADRSAKFLQGTAQRLLTGGRLRWTNYLEGDFTVVREMQVQELSMKLTADVQWHQMPDLASIDEHKFQNYNLAILAQPGALGPDPVATLGSLHRVLKPEGILVLGTQYDWPGARQAASGVEALTLHLGQWFDPIPVDAVDIPFSVQRTARIFDSGVQHVTFWKRRSEPRPEQKQAPPQSVLPLSSEELAVGQHLESHFGPQAEYPLACGSRCLEVVRSLGISTNRALELSNGPGRVAAELAKAFSHVDCGGASTELVHSTRDLFLGGELRWKVLEDRTASNVVERTLPSRSLAAGNLDFFCMKEQVIPDDVGSYDVICVFDLLDRLRSPKEFLQSLKGRLNPSGLLVLSSCYDWSEDLTPKENWLGGFRYGDNDGPSSYAGLRELLTAEGFKEVLPPEESWFCVAQQADGRTGRQMQAQMTFCRL